MAYSPDVSIFEVYEPFRDLCTRYCPLENIGPELEALCEVAAQSFSDDEIRLYRGYEFASTLNEMWYRLPMMDREGRQLSRSILMNEVRSVLPCRSQVEVKTVRWFDDNEKTFLNAWKKTFERQSQRRAQAVIYTLRTRFLPENGLEHLTLMRDWLSRRRTLGMYAPLQHYLALLGAVYAEPRNPTSLLMGVLPEALTAAAPDPKMEGLLNVGGLYPVLQQLIGNYLPPAYDQVLSRIA